MSELLADKETYNKVWRVVTNGYPYKTPEELGVDNWHYAYQATKTAIYDVLGQTDVNNYYGTDSIGDRTVALMKRLVDIGENGTNTYKTPISNVSASGSLTLSGDYYIQNYNVTANLNINKKYVSKTYNVMSVALSGNYEVTLNGSIPENTKITDINGNEKRTFSAGEVFQVRIPKKAVETGDINGNIRVDVSTEAYAVFFGQTYDTTLQNYAITTDPIALTSNNTTLQTKGNTGSLEIIKVDADTNERIPNVTFQLSKEDGTVIGTATTNSNGIATFSNLYENNYKLVEISVSDQYIINPEMITIDVMLRQEVSAASNLLFAVLSSLSKSALL